jgi:hypothetical protein
VAAGGEPLPEAQRTQAQTIVLNEPGSLWTERWDQLDINFKKNIRYGNKVQPSSWTCSTCSTTTRSAR